MSNFVAFLKDLSRVIGRTLLAVSTLAGYGALLLTTVHVGKGEWSLSFSFFNEHGEMVASVFVFAATLLLGLILQDLGRLPDEVDDDSGFAFFHRSFMVMTHLGLAVVCLTMNAARTELGWGIGINPGQSLIFSNALFIAVVSFGLSWICKPRLRRQTPTQSDKTNSETKPEITD